MEMIGRGCDRDKTYFRVTIRNIGRRAIYLSHAHVHVPRRSELLFLVDGLQGVTLAEGAPPYIVLADQAGVEEHADLWWRLRAAGLPAAAACG
jgi:hypothetical protein